MSDSAGFVYWCLICRPGDAKRDTALFRIVNGVAHLLAVAGVRGGASRWRCARSAWRASWDGVSKAKVERELRVAVGGREYSETVGFSGLAHEGVAVAWTLVSVIAGAGGDHRR